MSGLAFEKSKKRLYWPAKKLEWNAVSGSYRLGALPTGLYGVSRREAAGYTSQIDKSYRDETGRGFFLPMYPRFNTSRGNDGGCLGIRPDGNVSRRLGCIGVTENAKPLAEEILNVNPFRIIIMGETGQGVAFSDRPIHLEDVRAYLAKSASGH